MRRASTSGALSTRPPDPRRGHETTLQDRPGGIHDRAVAGDAPEAGAPGAAAAAWDWARRSQRLQRAAQPASQATQISDALLECAMTERVQTVQLLAAAAALGCGIAQTRRHIALVLEPAECLVNGAKGHLARGLVVEGRFDGDAIGIAIQPQDGQ